MQILEKLFSSDPVKKLQPIVDKINDLEPEFEQLKPEDFPEKTARWKKQIQERVQKGEKEQEILDELLPEAFALVREAAKRTIGQRHYDVQLIGGIVLHQGNIAEMKTGEGKTLSSTLPIYLNALTGKGVHVVTVNDYLSRRDASWMGQIYHYLGLSVGTIQHASSYLFDPNAKTEELEEVTEVEKEGVVLDVENLVAVSRREAYTADITYGTNNEFGFDYLRDNMVQDLRQMAQRELHYAIIDEVDSILIDEARTPLIISAPDEASSERYKQFASLVERLQQDKDYNVDEKHKAVTLTEEGIATIEKALGVDNLYVEGGISTIHHVEQALRAKTLFKKDRDYVIKDGEIVIVDEFTGRLMFGRRYSEGLHQAIEAKEGVEVQKESKTLATITFQNYFRLYDKLGGMTGTAITEAEEFHKIYQLGVVEVPTHKPIIRKDMPDVIYQTEKARTEAIAEDIKKRQQAGQPVLVGTTSVQKNEELSAVLQKKGIVHEVLNAKNHEREAHIIAQAGKPGAVTIATNMAGRGVDIILGGNPPDKELHQQVLDAGGLHVIGTERHESRRIDNQLRGRSGRQGDPGSTQFFLSLEDDLVRLFGGDRIKAIVNKLNMPEDEPITHSMVSKTIENAQKKIEGLNFDRRKHVVEFDDVINKHRTAIYNKRRAILEDKQNLREDSIEVLKRSIDSAINAYASSSAEGIDKAEIRKIVGTLLPITKEIETIIATEVDAENLANKLKEQAVKLYEKREQELGEGVMRSIEKFLWLRVIDQLWQEHINTMDHLRDSVRLRAYGQRDPLVEYKKEGYTLYQRLLDSIDNEVAFLLFKVNVVQQPQPMQQVVTNSSNSSSTLPANNNPFKDAGRNDPCPCGAKHPDGTPKKFKHCHGK